MLRSGSDNPELRKFGMKMKKKKKNNKARNLGFIAIIIAMVVIFVIIGGKKDTDEDDRKLVSYMKTEEIERGDIRQTVGAQGPMVPFDTVHVRSEASGKVDELFFDVGDEVLADDPLVGLDQEVLHINMRAAQASVESARASLKQQRKGWLPAEKARFEEQIRALEIDLNKYVSDLRRTRELYEAGFASDAEFESAEYIRNQSEMALENAREQLEILLDGSPEEIIELYEANYRMSKAEYDRAAKSLGDSTIYSPMGGVILEKFVTEGSVVVSSQSSFGAGSDLIALIGDLSKMKILALVDETDIGLVKVGQKVIIEVDAFEGDEFITSVTKINPMGKVTTTVTNFEVEMVIDNPDGNLLPNLTAYIDIVTEEVVDVVMVPDNAVLRFKGVDYVFVVDDDDNLIQREVELGITDYEYTEVLSGLEGGEKVVVRGLPSEPYDIEEEEPAEDIENVEEIEEIEIVDE